MRILLLLLFISLFQYSCSNLDDNSVSENPIVGEWALFQLLENDKDITISCQQQTTLQIHANGTYEALFYDSVRGSCQSAEGNGTWDTDGNNSYRIDFGNGDIRQLTSSGPIDNPFLSISRTVGNIIQVTVYHKE